MQVNDGPAQVAVADVRLDYRMALIDSLGLRSDFAFAGLDHRERTLFCAR